MKAKRNEEQQLLERLRRDAVRLGEVFGLQYKAVGKTRKDARIFGCCDTEGAIRIRLYSRTTGDFLQYSSLVATLCHEMAHLRHFDHGPDFKLFYRQLLLGARVLGIYRPATSSMVAPPVVDRTIRAAIAASAGPRRPRKAKPKPRQDPRQGRLF